MVCFNTIILKYNVSIDMCDACGNYLMNYIDYNVIRINNQFMSLLSGCKEIGCFFKYEFLFFSFFVTFWFLFITVSCVCDAIDKILEHI